MLTSAGNGVLLRPLDGIDTSDSIASARSRKSAFRRLAAAIGPPRCDEEGGRRRQRVAKVLCHCQRISTFFFYRLAPLVLSLGVLLGVSILLWHGATPPPRAGRVDEEEWRLSRRNGNQLVAGDVYGNGVRVGIYLQMVGLLISCASFHTGGVKVACAATTLAMLACWTQLARGRDLSACEAHLISTLVGMAPLVGSMASSIPDNSSIFGSVALGVSGVWALVSNFWFWATLYAQLPELDTPGLAWFFTAVSLYGWFRIFMLVLLSFETVFVVFFTVGVIVSVLSSAEQGVRKVSEEELTEALEEYIVGVWSATGTSAIVLVLVIASAEMTIRYNDLEPESSLSKPGQAIPLGIGIVVLLDGLVSLVTMLLAG